MTRTVHMIRKSLTYDVLLAVLYSWSVFEAYAYDAKTRTSGILIYVAVYGGFTLLIRSPLGVLLMNLLSAITIPWVFTTPVIRQAGSYFDFQPSVGIVITIFIGLVQGGISVVLMTMGQKFLTRKHQYTWSACWAIVFTLGLALLVSLTPVRP